MKLSTIPIVVTAAGLVSAAPIFVDLSRDANGDSLKEWTQNVRWGHAAAAAFNNLPPLEDNRPTPTRAWATPTWEPYRGQVWETQRPDPTPVPEWVQWKPYTEQVHTTPVWRNPSWANPTAANPTWAPPAPTYLPEYTPYPNPTPNPGFIFDYGGRYGSYGRPSRPAMRQGGCHGRGGARAKTMELGNKLRIILGLPPILDYPYRQGSTIVIVESLPRPMVVPTHHRHHMRPHRVHAPFYVRLTHALSMLGPWEGRAVSFVLGCGVGVLLRMLFVFGVLIVRASRARRAEAEGRVALVEDSVIFVAEDVKEPVIETLPEYAEKTEDAPQSNNAH